VSARGRAALVTGGAGFIGSHLVEGLRAAGWSVRVLDDFSTGCADNLAAAADGVEVVRGDVRDGELLAKALRDVEVVFHHAAIPSMTWSFAEPLASNGVNLEGTLRVLEASRRCAVRRVVYAASCAAYGNAPGLPKREDMAPDLRSPYALQKQAGEVYCRLYTERFGLETVSLRYFNVYGPRQDANSEYAAVIPRFVAACLRGEPPTIYGDGEQTRDFVMVSDVVRANLLAADAPGASGALCNVAGGLRTSLNQLFELIRESTGARVDPRYVPPRDGDVRDSQASLERAGELLGYRPAVDLREGLRLTIESFGRTP
jgi:UDP-glucose 4-epimerase